MGCKIRRDPVTGMNLDTGTLPMFAIENTPVGLGLTDSGARRTKAPMVRSSMKQRPTWTPYYGVVEPCTEGVRMQYQHEQDVSRHPLPGHTDHAKYRRKFGDEVSLMCTPCAKTWRQLDGFEDRLPTRSARPPIRRR